MTYSGTRWSATGGLLEESCHQVSECSHSTIPSVYSQSMGVSKELIVGLDACLGPISVIRRPFNDHPTGHLDIGIPFLAYLTVCTGQPPE